MSFNFLNHVQCSCVSHIQRLSRQNIIDARVLTDLFLLQIVPPQAEISSLTSQKHVEVLSVSKNCYQFLRKVSL